jgi:hypothetical protein
MTLMPQSDALIEQVYDLVNRQESERLGFLHSLDEGLADQLLAATIKAAIQPQRAGGRGQPANE